MTKLFEQYPDIVSVHQLAEMLRIGTVLAYKLVASGEIKARKVGRAYKIPKAAVADFLLNGEIEHDR